MGPLTVFRRCATLEEALIVASLLRDGGFYCSLGEYHIGSLQWDIVAAIGGVSVWVRQSQLLEAGQYLLDMRASAEARLSEEFGPIDTTPLKLRWGRAWTMLIIYSGFGYLLLIPLAWLFTLLPIDFSTSPAPYQPYDDYGPDYATENLGLNWDLPRWNPEGFLLVIALALFLVFDITGVKDRQRMRTDSDDAAS